MLKRQTKLIKNKEYSQTNTWMLFLYTSTQPIYIYHQRGYNLTAASYLPKKTKQLGLLLSTYLYLFNRLTDIAWSLLNNIFFISFDRMWKLWYFWLKMIITPVLSVDKDWSRSIKGKWHLSCITRSLE